MGPKYFFLRLTMVSSTPKTGIAKGMNKGHIVTTKEKGRKDTPKYRKGTLNKRVKFVRDVVRETVGFAPYEKRLMELLKVGKEKRTLKLAKQRLGTHRRAKAKREEMSTVLRQMRNK